MSVGVTWLVEDQLLYLNSWDTVTVPELMEMDERIGAMIENSDAHLVHGIHDHSQSQKLPSIRDLMKVKSAKHPRVGWLIYIGMDNKLLKFFLSAATQSFNIRLRFMDTIEEALTFLQDVDTSLPDLKSIDIAAAESHIREHSITLDEVAEPV